MPYLRGLKIYERDIEKENNREEEDRLWGLYSSIYPFMLLGHLKATEYPDFKNMWLGTSKTNEVVTNSKADNLSKFQEMSEEEFLNWIDGFDENEVLTEKSTGQNIVNRW